MQGRDKVFEDILESVMSTVEETEAQEQKIKEMVGFYEKVLEGNKPYDAIVKLAEEHEMKPEEIFALLKEGGHVNTETLDELKEPVDEEVEEKIGEPKAEKPKELKGKGAKDHGKLKKMESKVNEDTTLSDEDLEDIAGTIRTVIQLFSRSEAPELYDKLVYLHNRYAKEKEDFTSEGPYAERRVHEKQTPKGLRAKAKKADREATKLRTQADKLEKSQMKDKADKKKTNEEYQGEEEKDVWLGQRFKYKGEVWRVLDTGETQSKVGTEDVGSTDETPYIDNKIILRNALGNESRSRESKASEGIVPEEGKDDEATKIKKLTEDLAKEVSALSVQAKKALDAAEYEEAMDLVGRLSQVQSALPMKVAAPRKVELPEKPAEEVEEEPEDESPVEEKT